MTDPKLATHPRIVIGESDFSRYVSEHYGRPYNLQQQGDMLGQESAVKLTVPDPEDGEWEGMTMPTLVQWQEATPPGDHPEGGYDPNVSRENMRWEREYYPQLEAVANDLHAKGLLDAGEYILFVSW